MIEFLYTNIGRGHPFYLDGIIEILKQKDFDRIVTSDVFEISKGQSLAAWKLARKLYKIGSTDSVIGKMYNKLRDRSEYDKQSFAMKTMGRDIAKRYAESESPLVVAHPVLVGMLKGRRSLIYQHGEIAVPKQAVVKGAEYVLVPIEQCKKPFVQAGYSDEQVIVTGLCVEPSLVSQAEGAFEKRLKRIESKHPLTGAFFTSGAEPKPHISQIARAVRSLANGNGNAIVFAKSNGRLDRHLRKVIFKNNRNNSIKLISYSTRKELELLTSSDLSTFDYFVSPSHERTNWALGLGLPMFVLEPPIGPFAPLNKSILQKSKVSKSIDYRMPDEFCYALDFYKKSGELKKMAQNGWKKFPINGFEKAADFLINKFPLNS